MTIVSLPKFCAAIVLSSLALIIAACDGPRGSEGDVAAISGHNPAFSDSLPYYSTKDFTPLWLDPAALEAADLHTIPAFSFTNQDGETRTNASYRGKIYVSSFFFATCPGICGTITSRLQMVQKEFAEDDAVRLLSHSITPEIDTVPVLKQFATDRQIQSGKWDLVTGDRDEIYAVAKRGYFANEDLGEAQAKGDFTHTGNVLLVDQGGRIRGIYNGMSSSAMFELIADINKLKAEPHST